MLSEEEEAALLAEYGVLGLDDILLTVPAASRFRSDYGDTTVFLTGAADINNEDDADLNGSVKRRAASSSANTDSALLRSGQYPLESVLVKHTDLLNVSAPSALTGALGDALASLRAPEKRNSTESVDQNTGPRADYAAILRQGRSVEQRTAQITAGELSRDVDLAMVTTAVRDSSLLRDPPAGANHNGDGDTEEVQRAAKLLADAEAAIARSSRPDPGADDQMARYLDNVRRDIERLNEDAYDTLLERQDVLNEDDDDEERLIVLRECAAHRTAWRTTKARLESDEESHSPKEPGAQLRRDTRASATSVDVSAEGTPAPTISDRANESLPSPSRAVVPLPLSLFAFEMELSQAEKDAAIAWDTQDVADTASPVTAQGQPQAAVASAAPPVFVLSPEVHTVLHAIEQMEARDRDDEAVARQSLRHAIQTHHAKDKATTEARLREKTGMVSLEQFVKRVDELLPPVAEEKAMRQRHDRSLGDDANTATTVSAATSVEALSCAKTAPLGATTSHSEVPERTEGPSATVSLEAVQRQAARELAAIEMAAMEARRMREEDTRMQNWMDWLQERRDDIQHLLELCVKDSVTARDAIDSEETAAFKDLRIAEQRQLLLIRQAQRVRLMKATEHAAQTLLSAHAQLASTIEAEEGAAFADLTDQWWRSVAVVYVGLLRQYVLSSERREEAFARTTLGMAPMRTQPLLMAARPDSAVATEGEAAPPAYLHISRTRAVEAEEKALSQWARGHDHADAVTGALQWAAESLVVMRRRVADRRHWRPPQHTSRPPTGTFRPTPTRADETSAATAAAVPTATLNAQRFRELHTLSLAAAQANLVRAPQYLYSLSFALEGLEDVDYASVSSMELLPSSEEQQQRRRLLGASLHAAELARVLNLGSNAFTALSLVELLEVFPSLARLTLSDNALNSLVARRSDARAVSSGSAVRGVAAARESALADACQLTDLDLSSNRLQELSCVGRTLYVSLQTLRVSGNKLTTLESLSTCGALMTLDASRNPLSSLAGLEHCRLLQELNVCDTPLDDIAVVTSELPFLQNVYASQTGIRTLPASGLALLTLTQLFLNHCKLDAISEDACAHMPFLSVFHAEGNTLRSVAGLARCLRLGTVNVAANLLLLPDALAPLRVCGQLQSLDVRQNPVAPAHMKNESDTTLGRLVRRCLVAWFPQLTELNAEAVASRVDAALAQQRRYSALQRSWAQRGLSRHTRQSLQLAQLFAHDSLVCDARASLEVCVVDTKARLRAAQDGDDALAARFTARHQPPLSLYQLSTEEAGRGATARLDHVVRSVQTIRAAAAATGTSRGAVQNRLVSSPAYWRRAQLFGESRAKETIATWLVGRVLVRRARADLEERRRAYHQSEAFRREQAARRIQPVWRGAVLRSRLRRIVGPARSATSALKDDPDDDDEFVKVDEHFDMPELPDNTMNALLQKVLQQRTEALPAFSVPSTIPGLASSGRHLGGVTASRETADVLSFDGADGSVARAGTAPVAGGGPPHGGVGSGSARGAGEKRVLPVLSDPARPSSTMLQGRSERDTVTALEAQWGSTVAEQIRKKNKKMQTVHQQHVREQFMRDPLGTKKQLQAESKRTKPSK